MTTAAETGTATAKLKASNGDAENLRSRGINSLRLAIELFNRPEDTARVEAVLMLFHHGFEMLLKAIILEKTHSVHDGERGYSYGFDTCLRLAHEDLKVIDRNDRGFLSVLDTLRDIAVHYFQTVSEDLLYVFAQGSVSLFERLLNTCYGQNLHDHLPNRVLSICGRVPKELNVLLHDEFHSLTQELQKHGLDQSDVAARLRPLLAFTRAQADPGKRLTPDEVRVAIENLRAAENWSVVFPAIAQITFSVEGGDMACGHRVVKDGDAPPVRILKPGDPEPPVGTIIIRQVNPMDTFNLTRDMIAEKLGVSGPRTTAMIREFKVQANTEMFQMFKFGKNGKRLLPQYSKKALDFLREHVGEVNTIWAKHRISLCAGKRKQQ